MSLAPQPSHITRRHLARGAAWLVPTISAAVAAPGIAASTACDFVTASWTTGSNRTATSASDGTTAATSASSGTQLRSANFTAVSISNTYRSGNYLELDQGGSNRAGQTLTVTFPSTVYCLSFFVADVDAQWKAADNRFRDSVTVSSGLVVEAVTEAKAYITVSGQTATATNNPSSAGTDYSFDPTDLRGLVRITSTTPMKSFTLTFANAAYSSGTGIDNNTHQTYLSPLQYSRTNCACP